ncbi:hypothetical protein PBOI14_37390 [Pseudomonas sp. Boi14]|nr:hypothetical protein PBOI14_37390 [Pseudomonas sp. Boi14]
MFDDRFTLGASMLWTQWSSFKDLTLKSDGNTLVSIPYKYKDTMMYSLGGDYRFTDQLTLRAGVAYDQTPTRNSTRDPRIPDNDRWFTSLGFGYDIRAIPGLTIDGAYSGNSSRKPRSRPRTWTVSVPRAWMARSTPRARW